MTAQPLAYDADGLSMLGELHLPDGDVGPRPAVLVFPEAFGLGEHAKAKAERIASELGYVALAYDLHGEGRTLSKLEEVMPLLAPLRAEAAKVRARTVKALEALTARPEVDASRVAAIGFHSGLKVTSPGDAKAIKGQVAAFLGADDPSIPSALREEFEAMLREGGVDRRMTMYGGVVHSFTNPAADAMGRLEFARYDAKADARSWKGMAEILAEAFA